MRALFPAALSLISVVVSHLVVPYPAIAGNIITLACFDGTNGSGPFSAPVLDAQGDLFGTTTFGGASGQGTVWELAAGSDTITTLVNFNGANGANPTIGLTPDSQGNLYGITNQGGASGQGTVFRIAAGTHALTTIASFNGANGANPFGGLYLDAQGNIYGTTFGGRGYNGTVFRIAAGTNTITPIASFNGTTGGSAAGVVLDAQGNIYGTTYEPGSIFKIAAGTNTITTLVNFNGAPWPNGHEPQATLLLSQGSLYGTTFGGGPTGMGEIFKFDINTNTFSIVAAFNGADGSNSNSALVNDAQGNLYGTAVNGGAFGWGTVFELPAGSNTISALASFNGANGATPFAGVVLDSEGNIYGTTRSGGAFGQGTIFELSAVPEPPSLLLMGQGILGLAALARRRLTTV